MAKTSDNNLVGALRALTEDTGARSETARLRDVFDEIETALNAGVRRETVLATLHENGFQMTFSGFKSALQRIRRERTEASSKAG